MKYKRTRWVLHQSSLNVCSDEGNKNTKTANKITAGNVKHPGRRKAGTNFRKFLYKTPGIVMEIRASFCAACQVKQLDQGKRWDYQGQTIPSLIQIYFHKVFFWHGLPKSLFMSILVSKQNNQKGMKKIKRLKHPLPRVFLEPGTPALPAFTWEKWTSREEWLHENRQAERKMQRDSVRWFPQ